MKQHQTLFFTKEDCFIIQSLIREHPDSPYAWFLEQELERAVVVSDDDVPEDVITINSRARVMDEDSGAEGEITVVEPDLAHPESGYVSLLTPVGASVIGLPGGEAIEWNGSLQRRYRVLDVSFQPEAENRICVAS